MSTDGECYTGTGGLKECVKQGVQWDGCPAGKMQCKADKRRCAASTADCATKIGCGAGALLFLLLFFGRHANQQPVPSTHYQKLRMVGA